jgi:hypothetical protein
MKTKVFLGLILASMALVAGLAILFKPVPSSSPQPADAALLYAPVDSASTQPNAPLPQEPKESQKSSETIVPRRTFAEQHAIKATDKLERLNQTREIFRTLAIGDASAALRSARQITNEVERETALLTLVTEWTHGELSSPRERARAIAAYGLDAGLGIELAKNPQLALLWANELSEPAGRFVVLQQAASNMLGSDPAAAFALGNQIREEDRPKFFAGLYVNWAQKDTDAALRSAEQLPDLSQQAAALDAIRSVAPVGIGAALGTQDGYPVVLNVLPGTPAELSGQLQKGDRILALSQGNNPFVDTRNVSLADIVQMIRGASGSSLQLQVLPANAPPNSLPRTVSLVREQLKFKK